MDPALVAVVSLSWKTLAAAGLIIAIGRMALAAGPILTGVLIALPVNAGPGLFFVALGFDNDFVARSVIYGMAGAGPVLIYLTAFSQTARLGHFGLALVTGLACWCLVAWLISDLDLSVVDGLLCVAIGAIIAVLFNHAPPRQTDNVKMPAGWWYLLVRGGVAGVLIASVATFAAEIGPMIAGLLLSFPTSLSTSGWALNGHYGLRFVAATYAASRKAMSLYVLFCLILLVFLNWMPGPVAVAAAFAFVAVIGGFFSAVVLARNPARSRVCRSCCRPRRQATGC